MTIEQLEKLEPLKPLGYNQYSDDFCDTKSYKPATAEYKYRRLLRDRPDLAYAILDGIMTPNEAYAKAGFSTRRGTFNIDAKGCGLLFGKLSKEEQDKFIKEWI